MEMHENRSGTLAKVFKLYAKQRGAEGSKYREYQEMC